MKTETKRFYDFTFEQLTKELKLKGKFHKIEILEEDEIPNGGIIMITVEVDEDSK